MSFITTRFLIQRPDRRGPRPVTGDRNRVTEIVAHGPPILIQGGVVRCGAFPEPVVLVVIASQIERSCDPFPNAGKREHEAGPLAHHVIHDKTVHNRVARRDAPPARDHLHSNANCRRKGRLGADDFNLGHPVGQWSQPCLFSACPHFGHRLRAPVADAAPLLRCRSRLVHFGGQASAVEQGHDAREL